VSNDHSRSAAAVGGEIAFQAAVATIIVAGVACFGLICYFGQIGRRVKNMRYRWQIRYREVSDIETAAEPKI